ncbi:MAG: tyrosine-protein phosphatase [Hyphomonadaceae bacterium]
MQDRVLPLDGVLNFRDFGGYDTPNGRVVRGALFRSASFHNATEADIDALDRLGVRVLMDLRLPMERNHEPNKWPGERCRVHVCDADTTEGLPPHLVALLQKDVTAQSIHDYMCGAYQGFPFHGGYVALFRAWFDELAGEGGPAVVHCAAGKDRTGTLCALTLHALGVPDEAIVADYELTNHVLDLDARLPRIKARMEERLGQSIPADALRPMLGVHADYLRAGFAAMTEAHGSLDRYLEDALGVDASKREKLRARFIA